MGGEYTEKSDMWSVGIVLYAMCYSTLPFQNDDPRVLKAMICRFVEERERERLASRRKDVDKGVPLPNETDVSEAATAWLPPDVGGARARGQAGCIGPLRLVLAALLALDPNRRPATGDLLENPVFRRQAER